MKDTILVFDKNDINSLNELVRTHEQKDLPNGYVLSVYEKIDVGALYFVGVVYSSETDKKGTHITIVDPETEKPVAELRSNYMTMTDLYDTLIHIMDQYVPRAVLCIDRQSVNIALINRLANTKFKDMIYTLSYKVVDRGRLGMTINHKERQVMSGILLSYARDHKEKFVTSNITEDVTKAVYIESRIEYGNALRSYLLAVYAAQQAMQDRLRELTLSDIPEPVTRNEFFHGGVNPSGASDNANSNDLSISSLMDKKHAVASVVTNIDTPKGVNLIQEEKESHYIKHDETFHKWANQDGPQTDVPEEAVVPADYYAAIQIVKAEPQMRLLQEGYIVPIRDNPGSPILKGENLWMSATVFENSFIKNGEFSFSFALEALKQGFDVARSGWNGKDMYITIIKAGNAAHRGLPMQDCLALKNNRSEIQPGWVPSQGDVLANDWRIVK